MIVVAKKQRGKGARHTKCATKGCIHSAAFDLVFLGTAYFPVCTRCRNEQQRVWNDALNNWPDEHQEAA